MSRYGETIADDVHRDVKPPRQHVDAEARRRARTVCKHLIPGAPGAISTLCQNEPATPRGYCATHEPK